LKDSDYAAEFSEHDYPPIDFERGAEGNKQHEAVDPKYRERAEKMRRLVKKLKRNGMRERAIEPQA
jgi:hypothetical protein